MKEKSPFFNPCETAAVRIQCWFAQLQRSNPVLKSQDFYKKYKCDLLKPPRIPSQIERLHVLSKKKKQAKTRSVAKENSSKSLRISIDGSHCNVNQKNLNLITPQRVAHCKFREHFLVSKRLKTIAKQPSVGPKKHQVVPIKSSTEQDLSQNPYLQEWGRAKEERHFQIGRVIKYLSD
jgi:hypothetical protein